ncbi:cell division control protein 14, SIN component-domain-containing protein [Suillus clintonianus]|uniref:cell division control protein 14, SIN component-domain-containing protein n=1 Tax=Suillus clintonianus TaxID=1904413 RepID=UPI001B8666B4|nr:cell division control protein 14, SIN component-domain-containing protein [Suillus clintonianus]KAG2156419.1 cell division control protein 14, SIN component-domain-containing protein [Suillus clintonianus]
MSSTVSSMKTTLQDALDDVTSTRSSSGRRNRALAVLEQQLALACVQSSNDDTLETYLDLQDAFESNVPSRILAWIQCTTPQLDLCASKTSTKERDTEMNTMCSQLCQGLSIIQGVSLHHKSSKSFLGRRFSLEILIELLLTSRHTPIIDASLGENSSRPPDKPAPFMHLTSAVLDTLLCVLVDSSPAIRAFEEVNGVQAVVKILKRAGTPREVRMKCLEFLYFYLMDENPTHTRPDETHSLPSSPVATQPSTPFRLPENKIFARPASGASNISFACTSTRSSSSSSTSSSSFFSVSSGSSTTTSTSIEGIHIRSPIKKSYSTSAFTSSDPRTPPSSPPSIAASARKIPAPLQSRPMLMLRKEVDYEPLSPRKPRAFRPDLGVTDTPSPATPSATRFRETISRKTFSSGSTEETEARLSKHDRVRTIDEKKEILGGMLGNVDALVDGVRKAGIWGLG